MFLLINKETWKIVTRTDSILVFVENTFPINENDLEERDLLILENGWKFNFETNKVEETEESRNKMLEIEKNQDIENAKEFYSEMKNLRLKYLTTEIMKTWNPERDAEVDKLLQDLAKDNLALNNRLDEMEANFQEKYWESVILLIKWDKKI